MDIDSWRSTGAGRDGQLLAPGHDAHRRKARRPHRPPIQDPQKDGYDPLHVLQLRYASSLSISTYHVMALTLTDGQTTSHTSSPFNCTRSTGAQDTSRSLLVHMGTTRRTSMDRSTRWTLCACPCTKGCTPNGARRGRGPGVHLATTTQWRSRLFTCCTIVWHISYAAVRLHPRNPFILT